MEVSPALALYRFAIEALFHEQEHVLDEQGERLLSYATRSSSVSHESYSALTTADMKPPTIGLSGGEQVALSYGQYRAILETNRKQEDRATAYAPSIRSTPTIATPTRRSTTASCKGTGFTPEHADTKRRSRPHCTETTFLRPWLRR